MIYRPHFAYDTPENCTDEAYEYYYDLTSVVSVTIPIGGTVPSVLLGPIDKDAPFHWRGFRIQSNSDPEAIDNLDRGVQFRVNGELLSDAPINLALYAQGAGFAGQFQGGQSVVWDEEIVLPPGAVIESTWSAEIAGMTVDVLPYAGVTLWGIKRYTGEVRRAA